MMNFRKYVRYIGIIVGVMIMSGCAGAYVGVGVHAPGPWVGPYGGPGVTIGTGRPISSGYYPAKPDARQFVTGETVDEVISVPGEQTVVQE
jgi:hypothetical protein